MTFFLSDRYLVFGEISKGGMGELHVALDRMNGDQRVALKLISNPIEGSDLETLKAEYNCLTHLSHPNIVQIYDFGYDKPSKRFFFTEEFVKGQTLLSCLGKLTFDKILEVTVQICQALAHLHDRGVLHGDIKPSNILLSEDQIKIVDFGLAQPRAGKRDKPIGGTLPYLAPEILSGGNPTARSDLYSLGILLYELSTGKRPFEITDFPTALKAHHLETPIHPSLLSSTLPAAWGELILRLLNKDPKDRPEEAATVIREINLSFGKSFPLETIPSRKSRLASLPLVDRQNLFKEFAESLKSDKINLFLFQGKKGTGKSRLLSELKKRYAEVPGLRTIDNFDALTPQEQMALVEQNRKGKGMLLGTVSEYPLIPLPRESHRRFSLKGLRESETAKLLEEALASEIPVSFAKEVFLLTEGNPGKMLNLVEELYEEFLIPYEPIPPQLMQLELFEIFEKDAISGFRRKVKSRYQSSLKRTIAIYEKMVQQGNEEERDTLASLYYEMGELDQVLKVLAKSKERSSKNQLLTARTLIKKGDFSKAEALLDSLDKQKHDAADRAQLKNSRGILCYYRSENRRAEGYFKEARKFYLSIGDKLHAAAADNSLANIYLRDQKEPEAEKLYNTALKLSQEVYDLMGQGSYLMNLGALYQQQQNYKKALGRYYESLIRFQRIGFRLEIPRVLNNLANTHLQMGNSLRARELVCESIELSQEKGLAYLEGYGLLIQGDINTHEGKLSEARGNYTSARKRFHELGTESEKALACIGLLTSFAEEGDWKSYEKEEESVQQLIEKLGTPLLNENFQKAVFVAHFAKGDPKGDKFAEGFKSSLPFLKNGTSEERRILVILERIAKKNQDTRALQWLGMRLGRVGICHSTRQERTRQWGKEGYQLLDHLHEVHSMIAAGRPTQEIVELILDNVLKLSGSDRGLLILKSGESFQVNASKNMAADQVNELGLRISSTITHSVFRSGLPSVISNTQDMEPIIQSVSDLGLKSIICLPLNANGETIGIIYADSQRMGNKERKLSMLQAYADEATLAILNSNLLEELKAKHKAMQEAQSIVVQNAKLSTLGQMAAGIAHEVSNPLAAIRCHVEMLLQEGVKELQPVLNSVEKISSILHQVRFFAGKEKPKLTVIDLAKVIGRTLDSFELSKDANIRIKRTIPSIPQWVSGNEVMIEQTLINLLSNAQEAILNDEGTQGEIHVTVQKGNKGWVRLSVADNGPGITPEVKDKILEPFFTTKDISQNRGGMGLGLTIIMNIVHQHGGKLHIESEPSGGSRFVILLPTVKAPKRSP